MVKVSTDLFKYLISQGENRIATIGKWNNKPVNIYELDYKNDHYTLIEDEKNELYYALQKGDKVTSNKEGEDILNGLKNALQDVINILQEASDN